MLAKRVLPLVLLLALGCSAALAPGASAKAPSGRLVSFRQCSGILNSDDFGDNLEEVSPTHTIDETKATECKFGGTTDGGGGALKKLINGELGTECLAVTLNIVGTGGTAPEGDCYRLATETALFITGRLAKKLLVKLEKGTKRRFWPTGYSRKKLPHVGNDAEYGYHGGKGFGYLQVLNASVEVETDENDNMPGLLREAAKAL